MPIGDPGNESFQHLPGHPRDRIHLDAKPGGYTKRLYDPSTPATNAYATARGGDFTADLSRSRLDLFLQSPRDFWMRYHGWEAQVSGPMFTVNDRMGTLAEAHFDAIRTGAFSGVSPFLDGTPYANCAPFVHPTNPDFIDTFCGRRSMSWSWARTHGVLYQRPTDPHAMLNVYGEPDDILVMDAEDGGDPYLVVVDFKTGSSANPKYEKWFETNYHAAYKVQLEFYAWLLERILARDQLPFRVATKGVHIHMNIGRSEERLFEASGATQVGFSHQLMDVDLDWSWVEPTLDLALECILMPSPPPVQMLPMRTARGAPKMHDNWSFAERYQWLMTNHPGSWP